MGLARRPRASTRGAGGVWLVWRSLARPIWRATAELRDAGFAALCGSGSAQCWDVV